MPALAVEDMPPIFTHADARSRGVSDRVLYGWRDRGLVEQLARGIFVQPDLPADPDLIEIAVRAPDATLCLTTALARHGLVDDIPRTIDIALPRSRRAPRTTAPVTWHRFDEDTFEIGRDQLTVFGELTIGIYDAPRSIVVANCRCTRCVQVELETIVASDGQDLVDQRPNAVDVAGHTDRCQIDVPRRTAGIERRQQHAALEHESSRVG